MVMQLNAHRFRAELRTHGWSQRRFALAVSERLEGRTFSASAVSHLVVDPPRMNVTPGVAEAIAAVLGVDVGWLFTSAPTRDTGSPDPAALADAS